MTARRAFHTTALPWTPWRCAFLGAFHTTAFHATAINSILYNSIPCNNIALDTLQVRNPTWTRRSSTLSEFGSEQLEFAKLSMHSGNSSYADKAESVIRYLHEQHPDKVGGGIHASCDASGLHTVAGLSGCY